MTALVVGLALAVLVLGVLVAGLLRSHAEILKALHELGAGLELDRSEPVPVTIDGVVKPRAADATAPEALLGSTLDGEDVAIPLRGSRATLLAFLSSGCTTCKGFWTAFGERGLQVPADARLVVVTRDLAEESPSKLTQLAPADVPVVASTLVWDGLDVPGSPYFVLVDPTGRVVGEGSGSNWPQVADLLGQAHADSGSTSQRRARDEAALRSAGIEPGHPSLYEAS
ncbi:MAG: hypothetical protein JWN77_1342 [Frankiales bacterium]|nr:hypothetical protein [Frankiales bacterium]